MQRNGELHMVGPHPLWISESFLRVRWMKTSFLPCVPHGLTTPTPFPWSPHGWTTPTFKTSPPYTWLDHTTLKISHPYTWSDHTYFECQSPLHMVGPHPFWISVPLHMVIPHPFWILVPFTHGWTTPTLMISHPYTWLDHTHFEYQSLSPVLSYWGYNAVQIL